MTGYISLVSAMKIQIESACICAAWILLHTILYTLLKPVAY